MNSSFLQNRTLCQDQYCCRQHQDGSGAEVGLTEEFIRLNAALTDDNNELISPLGKGRLRQTWNESLNMESVSHNLWLQIICILAWISSKKGV